MNRRSVLVGAGLSMSSAFAGCLGRSKNGDRADMSEEETREAACSHAPDESEHLPYSHTRRGGMERLHEDREPFALIASREQAASAFDPDALEEMGGVDALFEPPERTEIGGLEPGGLLHDVTFEEQAVLIWEVSELTGAHYVEFLGVTQPVDELIRAYGCRYSHGGGGQAETPYTYFLTVDVRESPQRAELEFQEYYGPERESTKTLTDEPRRDVESQD